MPHFNELGEQAGLPEDWMDSFESISMDTSIFHSNDEHKCAENKSCRIIPEWSYTPISYGTTPSVLYPGQKVTYIVDPSYANNRQLPGTFLHMIDVKIDEVALDMRLYLDEEVTNQAGLAGSQKNYVEGVVNTKTRNPNANLVGWMHGAGNAYK